MEKQILTELNEQVIIFHDGSKVFITNLQSDAIFQQSSTSIKSIRINGNVYTFSSMAKIISLADFYFQYPDQIPVVAKEFNADEVIPMTSAQITSMRRGLLKGLENYINEQKSMGKNPVNAIKIYDTRLEKIFHSNQLAGLV